jgi:hypothetical protein
MTFDSNSIAPAQQAAHHRAAPRFAVGQVLGYRVRQVLHGHRLQPDTPRAGKRGQEDPVAAEEHVLDAGDSRDAELDSLLEHADVPGVHADGVARLEVVDDHLAVQLNP